MKSIQLTPASAGRVNAAIDGAEPVVLRPVPCFPLSAEMRCVSLRDEKGNEALFIEDAAAELDDRSREALERAVTTRSFRFDVTAIGSIEKDFELRAWTVETKAGRRIFQTALDSWPRPLGDGTHVVEDVHGDIYRLPALESLDPRSRERLWALVG